MKSGWKDMYFAKQGVQARDDKLRAGRANGNKTQITQRANANIGSDAEIAAYLAREPVARRYEYDEPKGDE